MNFAPSPQKASPVHPTLLFNLLSGRLVLVERINKHCSLIEGPEGVKWELRFAHFLAGISCTGTGQDRHCDNGICAVGRWDLVKIRAGKR